MSRKSFSESLLVTAIAFIPILIIWVLKEFIDPRPFWVFYDHIESLYYYTSIELIEGITPHNVDNPGSTVQLLGAGLISIIGSDPADYPLFVLLAHCLILVLSFVFAAILVGVTLGGVSRRLSVVCIWMYFLFLVALTYLQVWGPEALYFCLGALSIACLFYTFENAIEITSIKVLMLGASIGLLIATKFIFLAWLPGLCLALFVSGYRVNLYQSLVRPFLALVGVALAFLVVTLPVSDSYGYMFGWIFKNATRSGDYGQGALAAPSIIDGLANWGDFLVASKVWLVLTTCMFFFVLKKLFSNRESQDKLATSCVSIFVLTSVVFSLLFVFRSYQQRYLLPVGLCGTIISILWVRSIPRIKPAHELMILVFIGFILVKAMYNEHQNHRARYLHGIEFNQQVETKIQLLAKQYAIDAPVIIYGYRVPHPVFALRQNAQQEVHQQRVDQIYPRSGHHTPWPNGSTFRIPSGQTVWDLAVIRQEYLAGLDEQTYEIVGKIAEYKILLNKHRS